MSEIAIFKVSRPLVATAVTRTAELVYMTSRVTHVDISNLKNKPVVSSDSVLVARNGFPTV